MKARYSVIVACAVLAVPVAATGQDQVWSRVSPPAGKFSVETPCSAEEVATRKNLPADLGTGVKLAPEGRVVCMKDGVLLVAGLFQEPAAPKGTPSLFDQVVAATKSDPNPEGTPHITTINGRRAFLNRQESKGEIAQTGFVEIDRARIVVAITGAKPGGLSSGDKIAMIDRFYQSIQVAK